MNNLTQHFRENEKEFINKYDSLVEDVEYQYAPYLTSFLDPREQYILQTLVNRRNLKVFFDGGFKNAERKRGIICPDYYEPNIEDYEIKLYEIKYAEKFNSIEHRQILGSILGSGIKREQLGDIANDDKNWQFACTKNIADYLKMNLTKIGRTNVAIKEISINDALDIKLNLVSKKLTISSLRLDNIISNVYNISRTITKQLVQNELCKVNFAQVDDPAYLLNEGDSVSVRGYGRFYINEFSGMTKKGNYIIEITKLR